MTPAFSEAGEESLRRPRPALPGLLFAVATLLFGFGLDVVFGLDEDAIKSRLTASAAAVQVSVYHGEDAAARLNARRPRRTLPVKRPQPSGLHTRAPTPWSRPNGRRSSVVEYTVLDALSRLDGWHMRMQQLGRATGLSASATTRLVNRLEDRRLLTRIRCAEDRRGIYTELTQDGWALLTKARPTHDAVLEATLAKAEQVPELAPLVAALLRLPKAMPAATPATPAAIG